MGNCRLGLLGLLSLLGLMSLLSLLGLLRLLSLLGEPGLQGRKGANGCYVWESESEPFDAAEVDVGADGQEEGDEDHYPE